MKYTIIEKRDEYWVVDGKGFRMGPFHDLESAYYYVTGRERTDDSSD